MHLSLSPYVPTPTAPYAGHQFYYAWLSFLSSSRDVVVVAPGTDDNEAALAGGNLPFRVHLSAKRPVSMSSGARLRRATGVLRLGELLAVPLIDAEVSRLCEQASSLELSWSEALVLAERLRRFDRPVLAIEYDLQWTTVVKAEGGLGLVSPRAPLRRWLVRRAEIAALNLCDMTVVFKSADATALRVNGHVRETVVASPTLEAPKGELVPQDPPNILFVGAFDRRENYEGAEWFINEVLPLVRTAGMPVRVTLAGAGVRPDLADLASRAGVDTTGFVPDLDPVYRNATIAIAPIHRVGGLRFKVPQAMRYGLPVVATTEALRGLDEAPAGSLLPGSDRPGDFADSILMLLKDPERRKAQGDAGQDWVQARFSSLRTFKELSEWLDRAEVRR